MMTHLKLPFDLASHEYEIARCLNKDDKSILTLEMQLFNWTIKRYVSSWSWDTQW